MSVGVKIDGLMVLIITGVIAGSVIYINRKKMLEKIDPTNENNIANTSFHRLVNAIDPEETRTYGQYLYENKSIHPLAWIFEGIGTLNGDLP